ncbi:MAG: hypothetical protein HGA38_03070 [Candidatus Moranbacteria bacterium]|nr:hypothetical protein [Candidatus Moranbacteria bacterium]NTW46360.1 hypothetical protein [Candidatus Moranbacteria bacterium]
MIDAELTDWIRRQNRKLEIRFGGGQTERERLYARVIKLNEEVGELCDEILALNNDQREEKMRGRSGDNLSHEIADVLIVTLLIAEYLGLDPSDALRKKIARIDEHFKDVKTD